MEITNIIQVITMIITLILAIIVVVSNLSRIKYDILGVRVTNVEEKIQCQEVIIGQIDVKIENLLEISRETKNEIHDIKVNLSKHLEKQ